MWREALGPTHPKTRTALRNLADLLTKIGKFEDVKALVHEWGPEPAAPEQKTKPKRPKRK